MICSVRTTQFHPSGRDWTKYTEEKCRESVPFLLCIQWLEVVGTKLFENAGNEYVQLAIEPEDSIPNHELPIPVDFYVLGGTGTVSVGGLSVEAVAGKMISCPPNVPRGWKNSGTEKREVLVIKAIGT